MFYNVDNIVSIKFTSHFDTQNIIDTSYMFCDCLNLKSIDLSNLNTYNVKDMAYMIIMNKDY